MIALRHDAPVRRVDGRMNDVMQRTHHTTTNTWQHRHVAVASRAHAVVAIIPAITGAAIAANAAAWRTAASAVAAKRTARHLGPHTT